MRGVQSGVLCGDVGNVHFGQTNNGDTVCNFLVCCEGGNVQKPEQVWVRANAYGKFAEILKTNNLDKGDRIEFQFKLINSNNNEKGVELKITETPTVIKKNFNNKREF